MWRRTPNEERQFLSAVDSISAPVSREIVKALFDTFLPIDDFGTQESVVGALCRADGEAYFDVMGEELANVIERAPEWAEDIILGAIISDRRRFSGMILSKPRTDAQRLTTFIKERMSDEPEVREILTDLPV
jgi:hypothetical protein